MKRGKAEGRKSSILVCSGFHNKIPQTGWLNQQNLFLRVLEAGKSQIKVCLGWGLVRPLFLCYRCLPSHCVFTWWRESSGVSSSSYKGTQFYQIRAPPLWSLTKITSWRAPSPIQSHGGFEPQHMNFGGTQHSPFQAPSFFCRMEGREAKSSHLFRNPAKSPLFGVEAVFNLWVRNFGPVIKMFACVSLSHVWIGTLWKKSLILCGLQHLYHFNSVQTTSMIVLKDSAIKDGV